MEGGCVAARSSATVGLRERTDTLAHLLLTQVEVLQDRVAVGPRGRRPRHRLCELLLGEAEVCGRARQRVAGQAGVDVTRQRLVAGQERGEERGGAGQLPVAARAREEVV